MLVVRSFVPSPVTEDRNDNNKDSTNDNIIVVHDL